MNVPETRQNYIDTIQIQDFLQNREFAGNISVLTLEPPILNHNLHHWGKNLTLEYPDGLDIKIAAHIRSKPDRENIGCGDHFGIIIVDIPNCGRLIIGHGDDALGIAWKEGWNQKIEKYADRLQETIPNAPWKNPDVVHANTIRGFTESHFFSQFIDEVSFRMTEAYIAELDSKPIFHHPLPILESVIPDIGWSLLNYKSLYLQSKLYNKLTFLSTDPNYLKWYLNSVFGLAIIFLPDTENYIRFSRDPMTIVTKIHSNADYVAEYIFLSEKGLFDTDIESFPDPNKLPEELTRRLGVTGEEREKLRLEKPGEIYATYPLIDYGGEDIKYKLATGTTESHHVVPANVPVELLLKSDGIGPPETSTDRYNLVDNQFQLNDDLKIVTKLSPDEADSKYTAKGYNGDDRSILSVSFRNQS
jgi:hypothetical protein